MVSLEPEEDVKPVMRHQWMRGSIDDSQASEPTRYPGIALTLLLDTCHAAPLHTPEISSADEIGHLQIDQIDNLDANLSF